MPELRTGFGSSHAPPASSPTVPGSPHLFNLAETSWTASHSPNPGMTAWPQQNADPFASSHIPSILTSTHARNPQHQHLRGSNLWCQNISTVTSIPPMSPPLANAAHGTHHDSAAFTTGIESSHTGPERRSTSGSGSACLGYEFQGQSRYQMNGHAPQPPNLDPHHQLWCANCCSAAQMTPSQGAPLKLWAPNHWNGLKMDSASSQGSHGA